MNARERIEDILREQGCRARFSQMRNYSHRASSAVTWRVIAVCGKCRCQIGMLHALETMSDDALRAFIAARLAARAEIARTP